MVDITGDHQVIAEVSFTAALTTLHEKAIYLHEARQYQVERFDYEGRKAYVRARRFGLFHRRDRLHAGEGTGGIRVARRVGDAKAAHGDVRLNRQIVGFKKIKFYTMENVGAGNLSMPEQEMHTTAFWLHFPEAFLAKFPDLTPTEKQNGLVGLGALLKTVGALLVMCDPRDLGVSITEDIAGGLKTFEPNLVSLRQLSGRHRPKRGAVPADAPAARRRGEAGGGVPLRIGLPELRGPDRRSGRARQRSRSADFGCAAWLN